MLFLQMAWRNVWRYRRRSLLTVAAISLGLAFNIFMRGIGDGFHEQMVDNSVRGFVGHIEIHRDGYHDEPGLNKTLPDAGDILGAIGMLPRLRGYAPRVLGGGLISTADNSAGVSIVGIDPKRERTVTTIDRAVVEGGYLEQGTERPILLGSRLARTLKAALGEKVVLLVQAADGSMGADQYRVAGIFRSGSPELDQSTVYLLLSDAQSLFALGDRVTEAVVLLASSRDVDPAKQALVKQLDSRGVEVLTWYEVEPFLRQFIELDDAFLYIMVVILFVVISIGILNTIMMSVFERVREIGVMMALGMKPRQIVGLILVEALALSVVGMAVGTSIGAAATIGFASLGIDLSNWAEGAAIAGITTSVIYPKLTPLNLVVSNLAVLVVVMLVALHPAIRAARLEPVRAMRHI